MLMRPDWYGTVVLLSGGLDSTAALYWAKAWRDAPIHALSFEYGQRHWIEIEHARRIAAEARVQHTVVPLGAKGLGIAGSMLTAMHGKITAANSVVPGRNLLFLWAGCVFAQASKSDTVVIGACDEDQVTYLDCRPEAFRAMENAMNVGLGWPGTVIAPFVNKTKVDILRKAEQKGFLQALRSTWSCYDPRPATDDVRCIEKVPCEKCPACSKRAAAWAAFEKTGGT